MTKNDLAEKAGVSISFLSDLTNGKANPSLKIMGAIADALETALPTLLESTDLDRATVAALAGEHATNSLPDGYLRVSAVLTEFQAFEVAIWDQHNKKIIAAKSVKN